MSAWQLIKLGCIFAVMTILVPLSEAGNLAQFTKQRWLFILPLTFFNTFFFLKNSKVKI